MKTTSHQTVNQRIVNDFLAGKPIAELALEHKLDASYITLVLYQEGIHYAHKHEFNKYMNSGSGNPLMA